MRVSTKYKEQWEGISLTHPLPISPHLFLTPGALLRAPAYALACSISPPRKGKETAAAQATITVNKILLLHSLR